MISFVSNGFPYKDQIDELLIVMVSFLCIPTRIIFNFSHEKFIFLTATHLSKAQYSPVVLKVPLNPGQSITQSPLVI